MPKQKHYSRIAITLPERDLHAADRLAGELDRSRSWVIAEAVRRFAADHEASFGQPSATSRRVAEPSAAYNQAEIVATGLGPYRTAQLQKDFEMTTDARVLAAQETLEVTKLLHKRPGSERVIAFDRYDEFLDWKRRRDAGR